MPLNTYTQGYPHFPQNKKYLAGVKCKQKRKHKTEKSEIILKQTWNIM